MRIIISSILCLVFLSFYSCKTSDEESDLEGLYSTKKEETFKPTEEKYLDLVMVDDDGKKGFCYIEAEDKAYHYAVSPVMSLDTMVKVLKSREKSNLGKADSPKNKKLLAKMLYEKYLYLQKYKISQSDYPIPLEAFFTNIPEMTKNAENILLARNEEREKYNNEKYAMKLLMTAGAVFAGAGVVSMGAPLILAAGLTAGVSTAFGYKYHFTKNKTEELKKLFHKYLKKEQRALSSDDFDALFIATSTRKVYRINFDFLSKRLKELENKYSNKAGKTCDQYFDGFTENLKKKF